MSSQPPPEYADFFSEEDVMVVITTSTAGLGHKRVSSALGQGLPHLVRQETLGADDHRMQFLHRVASLNRVLRWIIETFQNTPFLDGFFALRYGRWLRKHSRDIKERLRDLIERRGQLPKVVLVVCTHFGLAHTLAEVKKSLSEELNTKIVVTVIVTDDSPQKIWAVYGADHIFVHSPSTKNKLLEFFNEKKLEPIPEVVVNPYPVSLHLGQKLDKEEFKEKLAQVSSDKTPIRIMLPISGAAVQLSYLRKMVESLCVDSFAAVTIVTRESKNTGRFIEWAQDYPNIDVIAKTDDRDVVEEYEEEFLRKIYSLEVTKPSEQAFKTLLAPELRGGVIMLFSAPVGRQEDDNVRFMTRHGLLPNKEDAKVIKNICDKKKQTITPEFLKRASSWRGILLPREGKAAAGLVRCLQRLGVFSAMMDFSGYGDHDELTNDGVAQIWEYLEKRLSKLKDL